MGVGLGVGLGVVTVRGLVLLGAAVDTTAWPETVRAASRRSPRPCCTGLVELMVLTGPGMGAAVTAVVGVGIGAMVGASVSCVNLLLERYSPSISVHTSGSGQLPDLCGDIRPHHI